MICAMVNQLTKNATLKELEEAGLSSYYADPIADLMEDMASEQKARAVYENLIDLTQYEYVLAPLLWLRQREVVHFNRFKELYEYYKSKGY